MMATVIQIPKLAMTMTDGFLAEWLVADGDTVEADQPIYSLEADKTEVDIQAPVAGTLRILAEKGETYDVGHVVAHIE
jgi:pyruvate/2-oxoglutarate dehydrogenase complex dihydrolipoamide acyltransferase (E2) component